MPQEHVMLPCSVGATLHPAEVLLAGALAIWTSRALNLTCRHR